MSPIETKTDSGDDEVGDDDEAGPARLQGLTNVKKFGQLLGSIVLDCSPHQLPRSATTHPVHWAVRESNNAVLVVSFSVSKRVLSIWVMRLCHYRSCWRMKSGVGIWRPFPPGNFRCMWPPKLTMWRASRYSSSTVLILMLDSSNITESPLSKWPHPKVFYRIFCTWCLPPLKEFGSCAYCRINQGFEILDQRTR